MSKSSHFSGQQYKGKGGIVLLYRFLSQQERRLC